MNQPVEGLRKLETAITLDRGSLSSALPLAPCLLQLHIRKLLIRRRGTGDASATALGGRQHEKVSGHGWCRRHSTRR